MTTPGTGDLPPCPPRPDPDSWQSDDPIDPATWNAAVRYEAWWAHVDRLFRVGLLPTPDRSTQP